MNTKVLLVEDHQLFRLGLRHLIDRSDGLEVVGEADTLQSAIKLLSATDPDVVVLDLMLPDAGGIELLKLIKSKEHPARVLALSALDDPVWAERVMEEGGCGFIDKMAQFDEVISGIRAVASGRHIVSLSGAPVTVRQDPPIPNRRENKDLAPLSEREREVLSCIAQGLTNQQSADKLFLSVKTVETYRSRLSRKLGVRGRSELFKAAKHAGLIIEAK